MSVVVLASDAPDIPLFSALTFQEKPLPPFTLTRCSCHLTTSEHDFCVLFCPPSMKGSVSMAALADVLLCGVSPAILSANSDEKRAFTEMLVRNYVMGVRSTVVCVDDPERSAIVLTKAIYDEVTLELNSHFRKVGYFGRASVIPTSVTRIANIRQRSSDFPWYSGPTVLEALAKAQIAPREGSFVFVVRDSFLKGRVVCTGRVLRGRVAVGDAVLLNPGMKLCTVASLGYFGESVRTANSGDLCGVALGEASLCDLRPGTVLSSPSAPSGDVASFVAQQISLFRTLSWSAEHTMYAHCASVPVRIEKILTRVEKRTGEVLEELPETVSQGQTCFMQVLPKKPVSLRIFSDVPTLGRLIITSSRRCETVGAVRSIVGVRERRRSCAPPVPTRDVPS